MARSEPYPQETRDAVEGMLRDSALSMRGIALRLGISNTTVWSWNRAARIRPRIGGRSAGIVAGSRRLGPTGDVPDLATLDAALRAHIARQIAAFDDRLRAAEDAADPDSAKILRDLGGLKRLLDDLGATARQPDSDGDADGGAPQDLAALRDRLARRIAAFVAEPDAIAAGNPGPRPPAPAG